MTAINVNEYYTYKVFDLIRNGNIDDVIEYIKKQDFINDPVNRFHWIVLDLIDKRLDSEGLTLQEITKD